jgi:hypothetical protein
MTIDDINKKTSGNVKFASNGARSYSNLALGE